MTINIGLVGFGPMGSGNFMHLKQYGKVIAAFDPNPASEEKIRSTGLAIAKSLEDLLNIPHLDAIAIASPPQYHADQVAAGLEAGKHVFSEVPMALKTEEIERIVALEDRYPQLKYQFGENYCFMTEVLYAAKLVEQGMLGPTVYAESEYLHDVTYRWRQNSKGDITTPRVTSWYSLFDPLAYAHSIGPAQFALGGKHSPMQFTEVQSYANDIGGIEDDSGTPICAPSHAFHVALFKTATGAIAKCANCYVIAREPTRLTLQVVGKYGTYECYAMNRPGHLFLAEGHKIERHHRVGKRKKIGPRMMLKTIDEGVHALKGSHNLVIKDWIDAIGQNRPTLLNAKVAANMTHAGIAASEAARHGKPTPIKQFK